MYSLTSLLLCLVKAAACSWQRGARVAARHALADDTASMTVFGRKADGQRLSGPRFGEPVRIARLVNGFVNETRHNCPYGVERGVMAETDDSS